MKKIILILFLFFLLLSCFFIYQLTEDRQLDIITVGDSTVYNPYLKDKVNHDFVNKDYYINDLINIIKYNQEIEIDEKSESLHQLLKKADILIISIGMNDIYHKLNNDPKETYTYLNNIIDKYDELLSIVSKYDYQKVYILNYYNITNKQNDLFTYINYKLNKLTKKYHYTYLDIAKILNNKSEYLLKSDQFTLNNDGYYQIYKLIVENLKKT